MRTLDRFQPSYDGLYSQFPNFLQNPIDLNIFYILCMHNKRRVSKSYLNFENPVGQPWCVDLIGKKKTRAPYELPRRIARHSLV
jgi:hypothetical protein